jgi:hypothetical protein
VGQLRLPIALVVLTAALAGSTARPVAALAGEPGLQWGGRTFARPQALAQWLSERGGDYTGWARRHPHARAIIEKDQVVPPAPALPEITDHGASAHGVTRTLEYVLLVIAALCFSVALLPRRLAATQFDGRLLPLSEHRVLVVTAGVAIALGAIVSGFAS